VCEVSEPEFAFCSEADIHDYGGLPRGALANPGRLVASVDAGTEILTLDQHGFGSDTELLFRAESGGSLPAPLVEGTSYYALPVGDSTFKVAATESGSPINLTTAGESIIVVARLDKGKAIRAASAFVADHVPGHALPFTDIPFAIRVVTAQVAAALLLCSAGQSSAALGEVYKQAIEQVHEWAKGRPIRGTVAALPGNLAVSSKSLPRAEKPRNWGPDDGSLP
jgi:hypothetical protein